MSAPFSRKHLSIEGLLREARRVSAQVPDEPGQTIPLVDYLMSGLALFGLKYPSLLQFEHDRQAETTRANLRALCGVAGVRCDATRAFANALMRSHRATCVRSPRPYLVSYSAATAWRDLSISTRTTCSPFGTGYFSSPKVHSAQCAEKEHRDGTTTYYHQMLGAVLVHPDHKEVFPLAPESILKPDGSAKN
ncbi:MAG TPA: hypothetical protein VES73_13725 [Lamprocystis sp. (in: g-proteobacteria)]|nr:hypothetical protein [Lamprocystis sp. (in: g-proteobacteria)]